MSVCLLVSESRPVLISSVQWLTRFSCIKGRDSYNLYDHFSISSVSLKSSLILIFSPMISPSTYAVLLLHSQERWHHFLWCDLFGSERTQTMQFNRSISKFRSGSFGSTLAHLLLGFNRSLVFLTGCTLRDHSKILQWERGLFHPTYLPNVVRWILFIFMIT